MNVRMQLSSVLACSALFFSVSEVLAETYTVCADPCNSDGCDFTSINAAIQTASDGDVIQLSAGTFYEGEAIDTLGKAITLQGTVADDGELVTILDGSNAHTVLYCGNEETINTVIRDVIVQNGQGGGANPYQGTNGGGMYFRVTPANRRAFTMVTNCIFRNNEGGKGGAVGIIKCNPTFTDCTFIDNHAANAGAVWVGNEAVPDFFNCSFIDNSSENWGGAVLCFPSATSADFYDCSFINNTSVGRGGGMYMFQTGGIPIIERCLFAGNSSGEGGALFLESRNTLTHLIDTVITGNTASSTGGAIGFRLHNHGLPRASITRCLIYGNSSQSGAALFGGANYTVVVDTVLCGNTVAGSSTTQNQSSTGFASGSSGNCRSGDCASCDYDGDGGNSNDDDK